MAVNTKPSGMPIISDIKDFDKSSGSWLERIIFNNRVWVVSFCLLATILLAISAAKININANFERMIPLNNPYIKNYLAYKST